jgi:hypothetical protein
MPLGSGLQIVARGRFFVKKLDINCLVGGMLWRGLCFLFQGSIFKLSPTS